MPYLGGEGDNGTGLRDDGGEHKERSELPTLLEASPTLPTAQGSTEPSVQEQCKAALSCETKFGNSEDLESEGKIVVYLGQHTATKVTTVAGFVGAIDEAAVVATEATVTEAGSCE